MRASFLLLVGACASALGCSGSIGAPDRSATVAVTRLRSDPYSFLYVSGLRQPERVVIRDDATWRAAWSALWPGAGPSSAPPNVDFSREMIVLAALGERSSGGYSILVDSATTGASGLTIWISTISPGVRCARVAAFTQPVDIARMTRSDAAVHFVDVPRVSEC